LRRTESDRTTAFSALLREELEGVGFVNSISLQISEIGAADRVYAPYAVRTDQLDEAARSASR